MPALELGALGGIRVNEHLQTSDPDIWAVGDAVEVRDRVTGAWSIIPLAGPANRQGRIAADNIFGRPVALRRHVGHGDFAAVQTDGRLHRRERKIIAQGGHSVSGAASASGLARGLLSGRRTDRDENSFCAGHRQLLGAQAVGHEAWTNGLMFWPRRSRRD